MPSRSASRASCSSPFGTRTETRAASRARGPSSIPSTSSPRATASTSTLPEGRVVPVPSGRQFILLGALSGRSALPRLLGPLVEADAVAEGIDHLHALRPVEGLLEARPHVAVPLPAPLRVELLHPR